MTPGKSAETLDTTLDDAFILRLQWFHFFASFICILGGSLILFGWAINSTLLTSGSIDFIRVKANTAVGFIFLGVSLFLLRPWHISSWQPKVGKIIAFILVLLGGVSLLEHIFNVDLHIDELFFKDSVFIGKQFRSGLMAPVTAVFFFLIGLSQISINTKNKHIFIFIQFILLIINLGAILVFFAYIFNAELLTGISPSYPRVGLYTAILFIVSSSAVLMLRPTEGMMNLITNNTLGGAVARRLLPLAIIIPFTTGVVRHLGLRFELFNLQYASVLTAFLNITVFGILILITSKSFKKIDLERRLLLNELKKINQELEEFAYVVSHDLKAPLRGASSVAEWIAADYKDKLDEKGRKYIDLLISRIRRMNDLINGILEYSRIGRVSERKENIDLNVLIQEVITSFPINENIVIEMDKNFPIVKGEPTQLKQVFQNLINNAIKYIDKESGNIALTYEEKDKYWEFKIRDNGPGIEKKYFEKIFQIFQTLEQDGQSGTGIGLTIVKKIIEKQMGKVWVESELGKGSTFFFTIPKEAK